MVAIFGVPKMFVPRWLQNWEIVSNDSQYFDPRTWTYLYELYPLAKTLDKYVNYMKLNLVGNQRRIARCFTSSHNCSKCNDSKAVGI